MELEPIDQSIVVIAERHNPSILHPSFLEGQGIIGKKIDLAEPPICTPEISIVSFSNGLRISVDNSRLQVTNHKVLEENFDISKVTSNYVNELPHVGYKSVGCNVFVFIEVENAEQFLINKFIKDGAWNTSDFPLESSGIRFVYSVEEGLMNISCDAGNISKNNDTNRTGILVRGNYHIETLNVSETIRVINSFPERVETVMSHLKNTFSE